MGGILKKELQLAIIAIALLLSSFNTSAIEHLASSISSAEFESGNYSFPGRLFIAKNHNI